jgi:hypothetical protein
MTSSGNLAKTLSLLAICAFFFYPTNTHADNKKVRKGSAIIYKNNVFELGPDTAKSASAASNSGTQSMKGSKDSLPVTMNGEKILTDADISAAPSGEETMNTIITNLFNKNKGTFKQLGDGEYFINVKHVVVGRNGRIQYYKFDGIQPVSKGKPVNKKAQAIVNQLIDDMLASDEILFEPANRGGLRVTCISKTMDTYIRLKVSKGVASLLL